MNNQPPDPSLEELIGRKLRALPECKAPASLRANVFAAIRARAARPWYQRAWFQWPRHLQALSLVLFLGFSGALGWLITGHEVTLTSLSPVLAERVSSVGSEIGWFLNLMTAFVRAVPAYYWLAAAGVLAGMLVTCAGLGSAFYRLVVLDLRKD